MKTDYLKLSKTSSDCEFFSHFKNSFIKFFWYKIIRIH